MVIKLLPQGIYHTSGGYSRPYGTYKDLTVQFLASNSKKKVFEPSSPLDTWSSGFYSTWIIWRGKGSLYRYYLSTLCSWIFDANQRTLSINTGGIMGCGFWIYDCFCIFLINIHMIRSYIFDLYTLGVLKQYKRTCGSGAVGIRSWGMG